MAADFRPILIDGKHHLSFLQREDHHSTGLEQRTGYVLDTSYRELKRVNLTRDYDTHEFYSLNNAASFLRILSRPGLTDKIIEGETVLARDNCAAEVDFDGIELFTFCALDKVNPDETSIRRPNDEELRQKPWNI